MKTPVAAAALAIAGAATVQAADIAPVTGHWTKLGGHFSALCTTSTSLTAFTGFVAATGVGIESGVILI
jgi:hypothetical protein